jgi:hypothetical protein
MTTGDILYNVLLGFILIWTADVLGLWARYDHWREERARRR